MGYCVPSLLDWDMYSGRNSFVVQYHKSLSLLDWDMYSGRNMANDQLTILFSLLDWDMYSGRNPEVGLRIEP